MDADAITNRVLHNGGTMLMAPTPVCDDARLALFLDPTGAPFGAWQPTYDFGSAYGGSGRSGHGTLT